MKKLLCAAMALILVSCFVLPIGAESIDLSALTWDELVDLKAQITLEQMARDEWQEVEVPQGVYVVGEDIPVGKWTVRCKTGYSCYFQFGETLRENGHDISWQGIHDLVYIYKSAGDDGRLTEYTFDAAEGYYIVISDSPATFTPFAGKPDLGFKK